MRADPKEIVLELHPLCTLFPRMDGADFDSLVADIKLNGLREPIITHDGMILDGGNRYRACQSAGVEPHFMKYGGGNLVAYVLSANLHRRHLQPGQHAAIVASMQNWAEAHPPHRKEGCKIAPLSTVSDRAAQSGTSERTQQMADKVAKADPDLAKQVAHGEISLPKAVEKITGKRLGSKQKPQDPVEDEKPEGAPDDYPDFSTEAGREKALNESLASQAEEIQTLRDRLTAYGELSDDAISAEQLIVDLRKELSTARATIEAITQSRDRSMMEVVQLKRQVAMLQKQIKKAA